MSSINRPFTSNSHFRQSLEKTSLNNFENSNTQSSLNDHVFTNSSIMSTASSVSNANKSGSKKNLTKNYLSTSKNFQDLDPSTTNSLHTQSTSSKTACKKAADLTKAKTYLKKHLERYDNPTLSTSTATSSSTNKSFAKNSNYSSLKLKNSTDKLSKADDENSNRVSKLKFNNNLKSKNEKSENISNSSNSFLLEDLSNMIVSFEIDHKKEPVIYKNRAQTLKQTHTTSNGLKPKQKESESSFSTASSSSYDQTNNNQQNINQIEANLNSNNNFLLDQMASFIDELKDFIDDRLIDTTSQLEIANKRINDLYNGINYLTNELIYLKFQNQELKQEITIRNNQKILLNNSSRKRVNNKPGVRVRNLCKQQPSTSDSGSSLMNKKKSDQYLVYECNPIYVDSEHHKDAKGKEKNKDMEGNNSQASSVNFYDNLFDASKLKLNWPSKQEKCYHRTSSQIEFTPVNTAVPNKYISSELNQDEDDEEVKNVFKIESKAHVKDNETEENEDKDESNVELSSSSTNEDILNRNHLSLERVGKKHANVSVKEKVDQEELKKIVIDLERKKSLVANNKTLVHHLHTSITPFTTLINDFDAQYSWDYADNNNLTLNKIKK